MKKVILGFVLAFLTLCKTGSAHNIEKDSLSFTTIHVKLHYLIREPFFYQEDGSFVGIEKEIIDQFANWARTKKNTHLIFEYVPHQDFNSLLEDCKKESGEYLGTGTITILPERKKHFHFSQPYLKNISVLLSHPTCNRLDSKHLKAASVSNSVHHEHLNALVEERHLNAESLPIGNQLELPNLILADSLVFGYMDLLNYWSFLKQNPSTPLRIHRSASKDNEAFGFVCGKSSKLTVLIDGFFEDGFGFTSTRQYDAILKKYLGQEVMNAVEIDE